MSFAGSAPALALVVLAAGFASVACSTPSTGASCTRTSDCPAGQSCIAYHCAAAADAGANDVPALIDAPRIDASDAGDASDAFDTFDAYDSFSAIGQRCSPPAHPCAAGFVCEQGACALDCGGHARCGDTVCCNAGDVCYLGACTAPGASCVSPSNDAGTCASTTACPTGQQCDPSIGHCLPLPPATNCEYRPMGSFAPQLLWAWQHASAYPQFGQVISTPVVADLDGDGANDVIVSVIDSLPGYPTVGGLLCALSGRGDCAGGPRELWCTAPSDPRVNYVGGLAVGDLDGTGQLTIVASDAQPDPGTGGAPVAGITGFTAAGARIPMFGTDAAGMPVRMKVGVGAPAIADLDGDGHAEVFVAFTVFDSHGRLRWQHPSGNGNTGYGPMTIAADLDGDGAPEVVGGNMAYHGDGSDAWAAGVAARSLPDGWPAVADFNGDGVPEIVVVSQGNVRVLTNTGALYSAMPVTIAGAGGPPTIADLDGDGVPDIAVAGSNSLTTFHVGAGAGHPLTRFWSMPSRDFSSNFTGMSVFDFEGAGRVSVIYGDECFARVYAGPGDGAGGTMVRFEIPNTSCTGTEYPVVADVDGDGKAEFVVVSNNTAGTGSACAPYAQACIDMFPGYVPTHGVRVFRDRNDNWVATRGIWNEHAYHVTNVCDGRDAVCAGAANRYGAIPRREPASWAFPAGAPLNRYRANAQLAGQFGAPDLVPRGLHADLGQCPTALGLQVDVTNIGAIGVPSGVPVAFYLTAADGGRVLIGVGHTSHVLLPGASETVRFDWSPLPADARNVPIGIETDVNDDGTGAALVHECNANNNRANLALTCADIG